MFYVKELVAVLLWVIGVFAIISLIGSTIGRVDFEVTKNAFLGIALMAISYALIAVADQYAGKK